ncbi:hypothetical protein BDC45DRAFT_572931 [Circinella umbellata]|nr:hypothetical protein BDC45DRAFT_572931 [Circinella umbellata]
MTDTPLNDHHAPKESENNIVSTFQSSNESIVQPQNESIQEGIKPKRGRPKKQECRTVKRKRKYEDKVDDNTQIRRRRIYDHIRCRHYKILELMKTSGNCTLQTLNGRIIELENGTDEKDIGKPFSQESITSSISPGQHIILGMEKQDEKENTQQLNKKKIEWIEE